MFDNAFGVFLADAGEDAGGQVAADALFGAGQDGGEAVHVELPAVFLVQFPAAGGFDALALEDAGKQPDEGQLLVVIIAQADDAVVAVGIGVDHAHDLAADGVIQWQEGVFGVLVGGRQIVVGWFKDTVHDMVLFLVLIRAHGVHSGV